MTGLLSKAFASDARRHARAAVHDLAERVIGLRFLGPAIVRLRRRTLTRSGPVARRLFYPNPFASPARAAVADFVRPGGIGDVILCTPGLRAAKAANPGGRIRFYTKMPELVAGLPYIDEVLPYEDRPDGSIYLDYLKLVPSPVHLARLIGDRIGVDVSDVQPDCVVDEALAARFRRDWAHLPRPWVVALRRASRFTPNKDWPDAAWDVLLDDVSRWGSVIEIGTREAGEAPTAGPNRLDLRGETSIAELVASVKAADIHVGPVSGPMHIAAAVGTPSVVIIGGYEHPVNAHYAGNTEFYTPVPCAPCWLLEPCPFDLKCLHAITPAQVAGAIRDTWERVGRRDVETVAKLGALPQAPLGPRSPRPPTI